MIRLHTRSCGFRKKFAGELRSVVNGREIPFFQGIHKHIIAPQNLVSSPS